MNYNYETHSNIHVFKMHLKKSVSYPSFHVYIASCASQGSV